MIATFIILALAILGFISNRIPLGLIAGGVAVSLWATGVLDLDQALGGFGDPIVLFIASLFIVSEALESTGITVWAGNLIMRRAGTRRAPLLITISLFAALTTALISVNGAVAALLPLVVVIAARARIPASQMLLPLAFVAHAGSLLTLTGSPVNVIVSDLAEEAGGRSFNFLEFALAGLPLLIGSVIFILVFGRKLLPTRSSRRAPQDLAAFTLALRDEYDLGDSATLISNGSGIVEVMVPPRSELIGQRLFPGMLTPDSDIVVIAAQRGGRALREEEDPTLRAGDILLLSGTWENLTEHTTESPELLPVSSAESIRRSIPLSRGSTRTITVLILMIALLISGLVPPAIAGLLAAGALIALGVVSPARAYRSISWTTVVLIAGMIPLSTAFISTGAADLIATTLLDLLDGGSPVTALLVICVVTMLLGQLISNTATVLIVAPVALAFAEALDVSALPFMMALAVSGAAAFLTPIATPANTMVMEPGGYRFGDYWRLGLPLMIMYLVVAVFWVPFIWPFH
ncbi:SLC13 family permease [Corynebacterium pacaense]|uniref:SLC13 family permease n=1 Tax=Corynebacterium pacaense TaxID=1816684 RepID=UPI0009BA7EAC|nr:SLC13 family permease [Corynebacterium pacaense]